MSEALGLTWRNVDRKAKVIRIETSKSGDARTLPYAKRSAIAALIERRREVSDVVQKERGLIVSRVFPREGEPIRFLRRSWISACIAAGLGVIEKDENGRIIKKRAFRLVHDLRRTFARNASRAGVSDSQTMALGGWKTASVFRRYNIVVESDLEDAQGKIGQAYDGASTSPTVVPLKAAGGK